MTTVRPAVGRPIEAGAVVDAGGAATVGADPDLPARATRAAGLCATALSMLLFGVLHVTAHRVHPVRDTLSDYALTRDGRLFGAAVLALAAGSALLLAPFAGPAARRIGRLRALAARVAFGAWCLGLTVLVAFPRDPVGAPATVAGDIHRLAAVAALCGLPVGALLTAVRHPGRCAGAVLVASAGCLLALVPFVAAYLVASPLRPAVGLIERAVSLGEVVVLLLTARLCRAGGEPFRVPRRTPTADPRAARHPRKPSQDHFTETHRS